MPLRVLLLLPDGEQPSVSRATGHKSVSKPPKSPVNRSFKTPPSPLSGVPSRLSNDYRSKPLPSPPPVNVDGSNRASNQTHLTLPSTSGSSAGSSSRSTEYVPSPPLSPDPTTASFASPTDSFADVTVRGLKLNPNKSSNRVKPVLRLNTKLPRTGKGLRYISSSTEDHSASEEEEEGEDDQDGVDSLEMGIHASTSRSNDHGVATARKAVDNRLQHLLATTAENLSFHRISHMSRNSNIPSSPLPHSPLDKPLPKHPALHPNIPPNTQSETHSGISRRKQPRKRPLRNSKPPSAPTRALPPYKIFGPNDIVPLDIISDPRRARTIPIRSGGWGRTGILIQSTRSLKPKGAKGKYVRLVTLPPLPPAKVSTKVEAWDEDLDALDITSFARDSGRRKGKGRVPTVLVDDDEEDSRENAGGKSNSPHRRKEVPTVYMTELVSNQWERPVPCMMWPPPLPPPSSSASRSSSRPASYTSTRPTSTLSRFSTSTSFNNATSPSPSTQILTPQTSAYQLPLPTLTPLQKSSLHTAGFLVYAVPKSYTGSIPPPECARVGEELHVREEEVIVGPWAAAQIPTLHSLQTSGEVGNGGSGSSVGGSPRGSMFGLTSPVRSPLSVNIFTANGNGGGGGAGGGGVLWGSLSPRWPTEGLGLWSRGKAGGSKRGSAASAMSGVESPVHSRPPSGVIQNVEEEKREDGAEGNTTTTNAGGWSSSFSSIRARAQGYYAKDASANPSPTILSREAALSTSKSEVLSTEASSAPMSKGNGNTIGTSRSFGSLFLRTPSSSNTEISSSSGNPVSSASGATPSTAGLTVPDSGYASSPGTGGGDVLFDYVEPPRDGEVVKVEIVETESGGGNAPAKTGWKLGGWGARWGS